MSILSWFKKWNKEDENGVKRWIVGYVAWETEDNQETTSGSAFVEEQVTSKQEEPTIGAVLIKILEKIFLQN